ncbi:MAG: hypothetical protein KF683_24100 [Rubrivivax sp.]|nr:hypothetical protein [Rubrivivax sp.]
MTNRQGTAARAPTWLVVLAVLAVPGWLLLTRWFAEDFSGWSRVAEVYAADGRTLDGSVGLVTAALEVGNGPRMEFRDARGSRSPYIELGFADDGFWLRSRRTAPAPALFVPWSAVQRCLYFSAWLAHPSVQEVRLTVQDQDFEDRCRAAMAARR